MIQHTTVDVRIRLHYDDGVVTEAQAQDVYLQSLPERVGRDWPREVQLQHAQVVAGLVDADGVPAQSPPATYVCRGWWHPTVKSGQVHNHPERPTGNWSTASHRLCEPIYVRRTK